MEDRRSSKRTPTILEGRIRIDDQVSYIECTVRNISETGAQIWVPDTIELPPEFALDIPKRGQSDRACLMWSRGKNHGIKFIRKQSEDAPHDGSLEAASGFSDPRIQEILEDARGELARIMGVPADAVKLKLEIDP